MWSRIRFRLTTTKPRGWTMDEYGSLSSKSISIRKPRPAALRGLQFNPAPTTTRRSTSLQPPSRHSRCPLVGYRETIYLDTLNLLLHKPPFSFYFLPSQHFPSVTPSSCLLGNARMFPHDNRNLYHMAHIQRI